MSFSRLSSPAGKTEEKLHIVADAARTYGSQRETGSLRDYLELAAYYSIYPQRTWNMSKKENRIVLGP